MSTKYPELPEQTTNQLRAGREAASIAIAKSWCSPAGSPARVKVARFDKDRLVVLGSVVSADVRLGRRRCRSDPRGDRACLGRGRPRGRRSTIWPARREYSSMAPRSSRKSSRAATNHHRPRSCLPSRSRIAIKRRAQCRPGAGAVDRGSQLFLSPTRTSSPCLLEEEADQIFDYRPSGKKALEVVMSWHGTMLDIEHFVREKAVTIGATPARIHFGIPPLLSLDNHPIVTRSGEDFVLNLDRQMKGVMFRKGKLLGMTELLEGSSRERAWLSGATRKEDFAKITIGEIDFFFSFTQRPRVSSAVACWIAIILFRKIFSASIVLTALIALRPHFDAGRAQRSKPNRSRSVSRRFSIAPEKYAHTSHERVGGAQGAGSQ